MMKNKEYKGISVQMEEENSNKFVLPCLIRGKTALSHLQRQFKFQNFGRVVRELLLRFLQHRA